MIRFDDYQELADVIEGKLFSTTSSSVETFSTNSTQIADVFFTLKGEKFDAHDFVPSLGKKGFKLAVVSQMPNVDVSHNLSLILVDDVYQALFKLAQYHRKIIKPTVLAITGSAGKTTTKEMLVAIFKYAHQKGEIENFVATKGNLNNCLGVPLTLLELNKYHKYLILEIGTSIPGEIKTSTLLANPDIAAITNIYPAHLAGLGSLIGVQAEKLSLFTNLHCGATKIYSLDMENLPSKDLYSICNQNLFTVSTNEKSSCNLKATEINISDEDIRYNLNYQGFLYPIKLDIMGSHNVTNSLIAIAMALSAGLSIKIICEGLQTFTGFKGRLEKKVTNNLTIIDDTYNANFKSMISAVDTLALQAGKKALVLGDMAELGQESLELHIELLKYISTKSLTSYFYGDEFAKAGESLSMDPSMFYRSKEELLSKLIAEYSSLIEQTTILFKASRSKEIETLIAPLQNSQF